MKRRDQFDHQAAEKEQDFHENLRSISARDGPRLIIADQPFCVPPPTTIASIRSIGSARTTG